MFARVQRLVGIRACPCIEGRAGAEEIGEVVHGAPRKRVAEPREIAHCRDPQKQEKRREEYSVRAGAHYAELGLRRRTVISAAARMPVSPNHVGTLISSHPAPGLGNAAT